MLGRGCRSRGVCEGRLYINTGDDAATFLRRINEIDFNKTTEFIELLDHLKNLQIKPTKPAINSNGRPSTTRVELSPDVEVVYDEWIQGNYVKSL